MSLDEKQENFIETENTEISKLISVQYQNSLKDTGSDFCESCYSDKGGALYEVRTKFNSFLNKFLNLKLNEFIQFVGPARCKPENLVKEIMKNGFPKLDKNYIIKKADRNIYDLNIAEFINYALATNNKPEALIKTWTIKYKKDDFRERTEFAKVISELMYTDHLKEISFTRSRGKLIAKLCFGEGKKIKVSDQDNKLVFSYLN